MRRRSEGNSEDDWIERRDEAAPEGPKQQEWPTWDGRRSAGKE